MGEKTGGAGRMVGTGSSTMELIMGSLSGLAFGLVSPLASQPFDTLKTKMQAEARYARQGMGAVATQVLRADGAAGLYRGILPIVMSTGVQKSALFSANAGARRACEERGVTGFPALLVGGVAAGTARAVVETPFELAKVRYQTGGRVGQLGELYTGAGATWARGTLMLTSFFVLCDYSEKAAPELMSRPVWKSTSASGAPDNSSLSHFSAMTRPSWLGRAARNQHRHAIEQASRRWRGGRRTRRKILISTQVAAAVGRLPQGRRVRDARVGGRVAARDCQK